MKCHLHPDRDAAGYCVSCGNGVCSECKREVLGTVRCPTHATSVAAPGTVAREEKSRGLTVLFSFFPGLGHIYLGAYSRGIGFAVMFGILVTMNARGMGAMEPIFGIATAFLWFFGIFDALRICRAINAGAASTGSALGPLYPAIPKPSARAGTLTWGVILVGIGALWIADRYMDMDRLLDFIGDKIGFIFIALGLFLIAAYSRRRSREKERELENSPPVASSGGTGNSILR